METGKLAVGIVGLWWQVWVIISPDEVFFRLLACAYLMLWVLLEGVPVLADWFAKNERNR